MRSSFAFLIVALVATSVYAADEEATPEQILDANMPENNTITLATADKTPVYNTSSILLSAKMTVLVNYQDTDGNNQTAAVVVPANSTVTGDDNVDGDYTEQFIALYAYPGEGSGLAWIVTLTFTNSSAHGASKNEFALAKVDVEYDSTTAPSGAFKNASEVVAGTAYNEHPTDSWTMRAPISKAFVCMHGDNIVKVDDKVTVRFDKLQVQPFSSEGASFVQGAQCAADKGASDLVPIIVGACLALLVVVVLVAYLIGRARTKRQGYASV